MKDLIKKAIPDQQWESCSKMTEKERVQLKVDMFNDSVGDMDSSIYDCKICKNKGLVSSVMEYAGTYIESARQCDCIPIRKSITNMKKSGIEPLIKKCTFDKFETNEEWQKKAKEKAQNFANNVDSFENKCFFIGGGIGCVDCDTEYFNGTEWKKISDYKDGEKVLQYNPKNKTGELTIPQRYIVAPSKELYEIKTERKAVDMCLSENHNFAYITSKGNMNKKRFGEVMKMHNESKKGFYGLVETSFKFGGKGIPLSEKEIRIMCAVIADGSFRKDIKTCDVNVKKERKKVRMRELLEGMNYKEYHKKNGYSVFRFYAPRREKEFTHFWYECTNEQLNIIVDEVFNWDGRIDGKRRTYYSTSKQSADFIQFSLSATGTRSTIGIDNHREKPCYVVIASSHKSEVHLNTKNGEKKATINKVIPKDGRQYCFTVETGYLIMRRNGRIFITGNSGKTHLCTAIVREMLTKGKSAKYMLWVRDSSKLKAMVNDEQYEPSLDEFRKVEVLYIDDFFKITKDGYGKETLPTSADIRLAYEIINYRYQHEELITIISSERFINEIEEIDSAVGSRIYEMSRGNALGIAREKSRNYRLRDMEVL